MRLRYLSGVAVLGAVFASTAQAQSIDPSSVSATMSVGESITIHKTITLAPYGANLVDLYFLADNTGSMGGIIGNAQAGASDILGALPSGADYEFGVASYQGDCSEVYPALPAGCVYVPTGYGVGTAINSALQPGTAAAEGGIGEWFAGWGGDYPEANLDALRVVSEDTPWRTGSQRLIVWFGDAPGHTESTTMAGAISALNAAGAKVIAFNSVGAGSGLDGCYLSDCYQASTIASATGGSLTNNFSSLSPSGFTTAVNSAISSATSTLDLVFGTDFFDTYAGGLSFAFTCTDALGCMDVAGGESRTFDVTITALSDGIYDFSVFADGVSASELDHIVVGTGVPEPTTWALLAIGLVGLGFVGRRRKEEMGDFA